MAKARQTWSNAIDFLFTAVGFSVGLGNVWRFPYLCFKNGGGAFLIPYLIFAAVLVVPMLILDIGIGQYSQAGLLQTWSIIPIFKGIALSQFLMQFYLECFYPILFTWSLKYLVNCFSAVLPWSSCDNDWNTKHCVTPSDVKNTTFGANSTLASLNGTSSAAEEFWKYEVLALSSGIEKVGGFRVDLLIYLFVLWLLFYLCTFKGIKWSSKVVYVTVTLPFILIAVILVRSVTLDGAIDGIKFYLIPDLAKLKNLEVWVSALSQVFYSNGPGLGVWVLLGSYNKYNHNLWRDSFTIVIMNLLTSFTAGFAVFSTLGFMAKYQNTTIEQVASSGPGLAFIVYPEAMSLLPLPQLWSVLFFVMIIFLGFDTQFVLLETLVTLLTDNWSTAKKHPYGREIFQAILCVVLCLGALPMVTNGGAYVFEIFNQYAAAGWCWFLIAGCECVAVGWFYDFDRFWSNLVDMVGERPGRIWLKLSIKYLGPITCFAFSIYLMSGIKPLKYNDYLYPDWAQAIGQVISVSTTIFIPGFAIYVLIKACLNGSPLTKVLRRPDMEVKRHGAPTKKEDCEEFLELKSASEDIAISF